MNPYCYSTAGLGRTSQFKTKFSSTWGGYASGSFYRHLTGSQAFWGGHHSNYKTRAQAWGNS